MSNTARLIETENRTRLILYTSAEILMTSKIMSSRDGYDSVHEVLRLFLDAYCGDLIRLSANGTFDWGDLSGVYSVEECLHAYRQEVDTLVRRGARYRQVEIKNGKKHKDRMNKRKQRLVFQIFEEIYQDHELTCKNRYNHSDF